MAVECESHSSSTRSARNDDDEEAGSQRRGTRWIALAWKSRAHIDGRARGIHGIDISSDGVDIGGDGDGYEEIGTM